MFKYRNLIFGAAFIFFATVVRIEVKKLYFEYLFKHKQSGSTSSIVSENVLTTEITKLINSKEYSKIDEKFFSIKNDSTELKIIAEKIANEIIDFDILLELANKTGNSEISYLILKNLWFRINSKNDTNLVELIDIYQIFHSKVIDINVDNELKSSAIEICEKGIRYKIQNESVTQLKSFLLAEKFDENGTKNFLKLIFKTSEKIFDDVNKLVIYEIHEILPINVLLYRTYFGKSYEFPMNVFSMLYIVSKNATIVEINFTNFWIPFWTIAEKREYEKNHNLTDFTEHKYEELLNYFSSEMKTLLLSENLCFRNNISNEYICEASSFKSHNDSWKNDQIELSAQKTEKCIWKTDYSLNEFFIIKLSNGSDESLFVDTESNKMELGKSLNFVNWKFLKKGNTFQIHNTRAAIFICVLDSPIPLNDHGRHEVSLMKIGRHNECYWKVENCSTNKI